MKVITFSLLFFLACTVCHGQSAFPVLFKNYRLDSTESRLNLAKKTLNQQFTTLITGQSKNSIGNFASFDPTDPTLAFAGSLIGKNGSVLVIKAKGGVSDGLISIFRNSKLNTNISLEAQYNFLSLGKRILQTNVDSTDQYERALEKLEYDYNIKRIAINTSRDLNLMVDKRFKTSKIVDSLALLIPKETDPVKKSFLEFDHGKARFLLDSLDNAIHRYDTLDELALLHNRVIPQLDKLSLQPAVEGFSFGWFSLAYKVSNNSFRLFYPTAAFSGQLADTSFVSHEVRVQYSYYNWVVDRFRTFFVDAGVAFSYSDNFNALKKIELSETTEYGSTPGGRTQSKKYNAYQGKYYRNLVGLSAYADLFYFFPRNNTSAIHISPEWITQRKEKPVGNLNVGFLMAFKNNKTDGPIVNAELYYKFLDVFKTTESEHRLFERNNIGIRFSFPIQFKYK